MEAIIQLITTFGCSALVGVLLVAVVVFIAVGGFKGWYVWGWQHRDALAQERGRTDFWRNQSLTDVGLAERAVEVAERNA